MDETLILLAQEVRRRTLRQLDGVTDEVARFAAPGLNNSILWHAGHALFVVEHLAIVPATGRPAALPQGLGGQVQLGQSPGRRDRLAGRSRTSPPRCASSCSA